MRRFLQRLIILFIMIFLIVTPWVVLQSQSTLPETTNTAISPTKPVFVLEIPQKALFRNNVVVSAQAIAGTSCELTYIPPSGEISIMETIANQDGKCIWKWKIDETQGKGNGRLIFTINGISETHFIEIRSSF